MAQKNRKKVQKGAPWGVIILLTFFYIGIPLMLSKLHKDKENTLANAKKTIIVGRIIFAMGLVYAFMGFTGTMIIEDGSNENGKAALMVALFFIVVGCAIIIHANKYKKLGLKYERYIPVISGSPTGSLDDMAAVIGEAFDDTSQNIQNLIDAGLLENSYIDQTRRILVSSVVGSMCRTQTVQTSSDVNYDQQTRAAKSEVKTVKCPNCGGVNNIVNGAENICDFCGSPIE